MGKLLIWLIYWYCPIGITITADLSLRENQSKVHAVLDSIPFLSPAGKLYMTRLIYFWSKYPRLFYKTCRCFSLQPYAILCWHFAAMSEMKGYFWAVIRGIMFFKVDLVILMPLFHFCHRLLQIVIFWRRRLSGACEQQIMYVHGCCRIDDASWRITASLVKPSKEILH